jgi:hypothetical protein
MKNFAEIFEVLLESAKSLTKPVKGFSCSTSAVQEIRKSFCLRAQERNTRCKKVSENCNEHFLKLYGMRKSFIDICDHFWKLITCNYFNFLNYLISFKKSFISTNCHFLQTHTATYMMASNCNCVFFTEGGIALVV